MPQWFLPGGSARVFGNPLESTQVLATVWPRSLRPKASDLLSPPGKRRSHPTFPSAVTVGDPGSISALISGVIVVGVGIAPFSLKRSLGQNVPVHIGTPRPRATATDQFEASSANDVLHRRG